MSLIMFFAQVFNEVFNKVLIQLFCVYQYFFLVVWDIPNIDKSQWLPVEPLMDPFNDFIWQLMVLLT